MLSLARLSDITVNRSLLGYGARTSLPDLSFEFSPFGRAGNADSTLSEEDQRKRLCAIIDKALDVMAETEEDLFLLSLPKQ